MPGPRGSRKSAVYQGAADRDEVGPGKEAVTLKVSYILIVPTL